jgi:hypothetical protein
LQIDWPESQTQASVYCIFLFIEDNYWEQYGQPREATSADNLILVHGDKHKGILIFNGLKPSLGKAIKSIMNGLKPRKYIFKK